MRIGRGRRRDYRPRCGALDVDAAALAHGLGQQARLAPQDVVYEGLPGSARSAAAGEAWIPTLALSGAAPRLVRRAAAAAMRRSLILANKALHSVFCKDD
jgi:hypothetical protein